MRRYVLAAVAALLVLSALALIVHDPDRDDTALSAGGGTTTTEPVDELLFGDDTSASTTLPPESTTSTTAAAAVATTAKPAPPATTTTLAPIRYPKGPGSPIVTDRVYVVRVADAVPYDIATGVLDNPRWSADGRRVLVGGGQVRTMNPDGSAVKTLAFKGGIVTPAWSVKGQLAGVVIENGNDYHLGITQANGSMKIVRQDQVGPVSGQAWSPDGERVAFIAGARVWTAKADGSAATPVTGAETKAWRWLAWSPDGARIAFYGGQSVHVVNPDGSGLKSLAASGESLASWSPDSKRVAFTGPESAEFALTVVPVDGGAAQVVGGVKRASSPTFSPDGMTIVFSGGGHTVETIRPDGSARRTVLGPTDAWFGLGFAWSPDGTHLLANTGGGGEGGPPAPQ